MYLVVSPRGFSNEWQAYRVPKGLAQVARELAGDVNDDVNAYAYVTTNAEARRLWARCREAWAEGRQYYSVVHDDPMEFMREFGERLTVRGAYGRKRRVAAKGSSHPTPANASPAIERWRSL